MSNKAVEAWKARLPKEKQIFVSASVKNIHPVMDRIVNRLLEIDRIQYVRVTPSDIQASNDVAIKAKAKIPITKPSHPSAIGVHLIFEPTENTIQFYEINSTVKGYGEKIVQTIMTSIPEDWEVLIIMDFSGGFWDKMIEKYKNIIKI